jgi:hypothetical protein
LTAKRAGLESKQDKTRRVLNRSMREVDAVVKDQAAGGSGDSKP